jgi:hypothetical protein
LGASTKRTVEGVDKAVMVDGVLQGRRRRCALGKAFEVDGVLRVKRSRSMACSGAGGGGVLQG